MPRSGVQYVNNDEPSFIKQFKERIGYTEGPDINSKRNQTGPEQRDDDNENEGQEREDEKPVVVVLKEGDLTADQAENEIKLKEEGPARLDDKITFKKPTKRQAPPVEETSSSASPADESDTKKKKHSGKRKEGKRNAANNSLLSFGDDEEEEEG